MTPSVYVESDIFQSFFMGGFECSTHRRRSDRARLDLSRATGHDRTALSDFNQLRGIGLNTVRDGLRWHLIEALPGYYDWSSFLKVFRAAEAAGVQVIWDLFHYGWPDGIDIFSPHFVDRFANFAAAAARVVRQETDAVPYYCPINEISYFAWAGGEKKLMSPFASGQGQVLKRQLVRASIAAIEAVRSVEPRARIVHVDPAIHVAAASASDAEASEAYRASQFQAMDMVSGTLETALGGRPEYLDIIGINYYPDNQWILNGSLIPMGHHQYRPFHELLQEIHRRYRRPIFIAETGAEGTARPAWLYYVVREVLAAKLAGADLQGICLYPVTDYPGWEDGRICKTGLLQMTDGQGQRSFFAPLLDELVSSAAHLNACLPKASPADRPIPTHENDRRNSA
jgi:beta-glucosidase/6-phospho-beta-glucosidase/beta-galactosidase